MKNAREPRGDEGRKFLEHMNENHEPMARWGTSFLDIGSNDDILDIGCGGGRNIQYFLGLGPDIRVTGVDHSSLSVDMTGTLNSEAVKDGRCRVMEGSVTDLPLADASFDIATAFETIYFWPSISDSFAEVRRVLRDGGRFMICNEADGLDERTQIWVDRIGHGMRIYGPEEIVSLLCTAGFVDIDVHRRPEHNWLCVIGRKG